ncbi:MAG TPA: hypothetical protein VM008_09495 [Phycisphaerae bacterium]|nr:hypothetical protein [Phycisphaerae bacterium]
MGKRDDPFERIEAIVGEVEDFMEARDAFFAHLKSLLKLPCEVTGGEDFNWEEGYVFGWGSKREYEELKKTQPSYRDRFQLLSIDGKRYSEWAICPREDIAAIVRRIKDGKQFVLGLSELEGTDKNSVNFQLLKDFAVFFANYR